MGKDEKYQVRGSGRALYEAPMQNPEDDEMFREFIKTFLRRKPMARRAQKHHCSQLTSGSNPGHGGTRTHGSSSTAGTGKTGEKPGKDFLI